VGQDRIEELPDVLREYVPTYIEHRLTELDDLDTYLSKQDFEGIRAICHKIVGSAASYNLFELESIVKKLQSAARNNKLNQCKAFTADLSSYLRSKI
jgi:HPt (histidine-containing phosphotransfer) domain-containing protein